MAVLRYPGWRHATGFVPWAATGREPDRVFFFGRFGVSGGMDTALLAALASAEPVFWTNPLRRPIAAIRDGLSVGLADIEAAARRLDRFGPLLARLFPELAASGGRVESALLPVPRLEARLRARGLPDGDSVLLKADHALPVAGSVKARGGFHAVLAVAEALADRAGLLRGPDDDTRRLGEPAARAFFAGHTLSVGSTGNLGLSIGLLGRALGFAVTVHMSAEAKAWKKAMLRGAGATVVEHPGDYTAACARARTEAEAVDTIHFIDDERSRDLFLGYAVAGLRLSDQLREQGIVVSPDRPLCLHLPCGVGGAPGGIALGARLALGDAALAFFVEPTQAPCLLYGLASGRHDRAVVTELGLAGRTLADGLAVTRPSGLVTGLMEQVVDGCLTVTDRAMLRDLAAAWHDERLRLEPAAAAALAGPMAVRRAGLQRLAGVPATHLVWSTGGSLLPDADFTALVAQGESVSDETSSTA